MFITDEQIKNENSKNKEKKYVSIHFESYKSTSFYNLKNHNTRKKPPTYLLPKEMITVENFHKDFNSFSDLKNEHKKILKEEKNTGLQKSQKLLMEGVLSFSEYQMEQIIKENKIEKLEELIEKYMKEIEKEYGLKPISFYFHGDEGHKTKKGKKTNHKNYHAHVQFYNFDFEKKESVQRKLNKSDFSKFQDLAGMIFKELGFERGISKEITKKEHKNREEFIEYEKEIERLNEVIEEKNKKVKEQSKLINNYKRFNQEVEDFIEYDLQTLSVEDLKIRKESEKNPIIKRLINYTIRGLNSINEQKQMTQKNLKNINNTIRKMLESEELEESEWKKISSILQSIRQFIGEESYKKYQEQAFKKSNKQDKRKYSRT